MGPAGFLTTGDAPDRFLQATDPAGEFGIEPAWRSRGGRSSTSELLDHGQDQIDGILIQAQGPEILDDLSEARRW